MTCPHCKCPECRRLELQAVLSRHVSRETDENDLRRAFDLLPKYSLKPVEQRGQE